MIVVVVCDECGCDSGGGGGDDSGGMKAKTSPCGGNVCTAWDLHPEGDVTL